MIISARSRTDPLYSLCFALFFKDRMVPWGVEETMRSWTFWAKTFLCAAGFGAVLGLTPHILITLLIGEAPGLENQEVKALVALFIVPSIFLWIALVPGLIGRTMPTAVAWGIAWPFLTLLIATNLNAQFHFGVSLLPYAAFFAKVLAVPFGRVAGVVMHGLGQGRRSPLDKAKNGSRMGRHN